MYSKMIAVLALAAVAVAAPQHQEAARFPAGVNPQACPSYPNCDNAALHNQNPVSTHANNHWNPNWNAQPAAPAWNAQPAAPSWNPQPAAHSWNPQPAAPSWNPQPAAHSWNQQPAAPAWNAQPQPHWNSFPAVTGPANNHLAAAPAPTAGGDKYPAGVNPHTCPNYPFCDNSAPAGAPQVAPLPGYTERQYPAGVSPHSCPNFPYCN
ncbi:circumsporozoite protein [Aedes albopictus]|uniref:Cuticle protein CPCFC domain-containing protein n=1 Tax=Aedes albopictus TaxID=7160 RepID=A0ABM1YHA8_AEDAL|nr:circumsporozoite protein [Aedes albopictus]KXJ82119.1 hypothetical protein RP20_CCG015395 [Aedes albopictus]